MAGELTVLADGEALARHAAQWITGLAQQSTGRFAICLSGGSTPKRLYQLLAGVPFREAMPWDRVHWFWGDERCVPWNHPDSNYGMTSEAMLGHVPIPPRNIHGIETTGTPAEAARRYERVLKDFYGSETLVPGRPLFDVMLLGLGPDGHTASLFPDTAVLTERDRWVAEVEGVKAESRITLTYPVIESSRQTAFLVAGAEKKPMLARARAEDSALPSGRMRPEGKLLWLVDRAAIGEGA